MNALVKKAERMAAGLEDPFEKHQRRPLAEHLQDFRKYLQHKGSTFDYTNTTTQRIRDIVVGCTFERMNQISPSRVQEYLADLRKDGGSIGSSNHYLRAIKMFTRWLVRDHRTNDDRLAFLSKLNEATDRRRIRRPLSMEEFVRLLEAAEAGRTIQNIPGPDRAILYIVGAYTGYRRNEIGSVTLRSLNFESEPLFDIADGRTAEMIRKDLAVARTAWIHEANDESERKRREKSSFLAYVDEQGHYADFHALRKTFITNLSRVGVSPKTAQILACHSDINLTMNTYTMLGVLDQVAAVEALPSVPESKPKRRLRKVG